jgi:hypothetical protein
MAQYGAWLERLGRAREGVDQQRMTVSDGWWEKSKSNLLAWNGK